VRANVKSGRDWLPPTYALAEGDAFGGTDTGTDTDLSQSLALSPVAAW
jgi:hypothetical protein